MTVECDILFHARLHWVCVCRHYTKAGESRFHIFTLTLSLRELREREQRASRSGKPRAVDCSPRRERFTLSPRERAGVRGKNPLHRAAWMFWHGRRAHARNAIWL